MKKLVLGLLLTNSLMFAYSYKYSFGDAVSYQGHKNNSGWKGIVVDRADGRYKVKITDVELNGGMFSLGLSATPCTGNESLSYDDTGKKIWVPEYCIGMKAEEEDSSSGWATAGKILLGLAALSVASQMSQSSSHHEQGNIKVINKCSMPMYVAIRYVPYGSSDFSTKYWWSFDAHESDYLVDGSNHKRLRTKNTVLFYYAEEKTKRANKYKIEGDHNVKIQGKTYGMKKIIDKEGDTEIVLRCY